MTPSVLLCAHGCGDESLTNRAVRELASVLRARRGGAVACGFNLGTPGFGAALDGLPADADVLALPLMMAEGYFTREVLPERLRGASSWRPGRVALLEPIGVSPLVAARVVDRIGVVAANAGVDAGSVRVVVVGHGTRRNPASRDTALGLAAAAAARFGVRAEAAFLDDDPLLETVALGPTDRVVIAAPWLLGGGDHTLVDIPERLGLPRSAEAEAERIRTADRDGRRHLILPAILHDPGLADLVGGLLHEGAAPEHAG